MAFLSDQYLRAVFFFAVGIVSAIAILKIWENKESVLREIRRQLIQTRLGSLKKTTKGLTEKVRVISYASGRSIVISNGLMYLLKSKSPVDLSHSRMVPYP